MPRPAPRAARSSPASVQAAIEAFLAAARQPVLQEPGELPFPLQTGQFELAQKPGALLVSTWDDTRQLHRRVIAITEEKPGRLTLAIEKFSGKLGQLVFYDETKPAALNLRKQSERHHFRDQIRSLLQKQFPAWRLMDLSADLDLEHSLSANYPRALLRQGTKGIAVIAAASGPPEPTHALTYGLIWLDYLRRREPNLQIDTLALVLPDKALTTTALRIRHLIGARFRLFNHTHEIDPADCGNLHTELLPSHQPHPATTRQPEAWLEAQVRQHIETIDATLLPKPVYGQVTAIAGMDRNIADLLAVSYDNRLTVLELKAEEDIHLPLQALDYWMRIAHHAAANDFPSKNYFPQIQLHKLPPKLLLIAPALSFHPTTETILRFFSSNIAVERIGIALEWRQTVRVLFRYRGAETPA